MAEEDGWGGEGKRNGDRSIYSGGCYIGTGLRCLKRALSMRERVSSLIVGGCFGTDCWGGWPFGSWREQVG